MGTRGPRFVLAIWLVGCGGKADISAARISDDAGGGRSPEARAPDTAGGAGGTTSSTGGAVSRRGDSDGAPSPSDAGPSSVCDFAHDVCGGLDSYVELRGDGGLVRLSYPRDAGCGQCAGGACELWSFAPENCGTISVELAACAGPGGRAPCLDTASPIPSYTDRAGKVWTMVTLFGSSSQRDAANLSTKVLDLDLTLTIGDGITTQELPVHVHTCGDIRGSLAPCAH